MQDTCTYHCARFDCKNDECISVSDYFTDSGVSDQTPGGSQYKPVGCYNINTKPFGRMLTKLTLNTGNKAETVSECGRAAWARARRVFAVGSGGECYSSMDAHRVFHKDGQAGDCTDDLIGGAKSVYVFALTGW